MKTRITAICLLLIMLTATLCGCTLPERKPPQVLPQSALPSTTTFTFHLQDVGKITFATAEGSDYPRDHTVEVTDAKVIKLLTAHLNTLSLPYVPNNRTDCNCMKYRYDTVFYGADGHVIERILLIDSHYLMWDGYLYEIPSSMVHTMDIIDCSLIDAMFQAKHCQKPEQTDLAFWLTDDVAGVDFSAYDYLPGFGVVGYFAPGYHQEDDLYVRYDVTAYPDYADGGSHITRIEVTDPDVKIISQLTVASDIEDWDLYMTRLGLVKVPSEVTAVEQHAWRSGDARVSATLTLYEGQCKFVLNYHVTNREGIIY